MKLFRRCACRSACDHPLWYRFRFGGREYRGSTHTDNRTLAQRIAARRQVETLEGREQVRRRRVLRLSAHIEAYTGWTAEHNRTSNKDPGVLAGFVACVGDKRLDQVAAFDVERWKIARVKAVSHATVNRELNIVRGCFSRAVEWGLIGRSPVAGVKPYRVDNVRVRVLSTREIATLLGGLPDDFALLARATLEGLFRISEILNLHVEDIKGDHIVLVHTKNNRVRKVPITPALRRALLARAHPSGYVFGRDPDGLPPRGEVASVQFCRLAHRLGFKDVSHHTMRHTGASMMLASGASLRAVQESGGWTSLRMLERYAHPSDAEKRRAVDLAAVITEANPEQKVGTNAGTAPAAGESSDSKEACNALVSGELEWRPQRDSNPCFSLERATS